MNCGDINELENATDKDLSQCNIEGEVEVEKKTEDDEEEVELAEVAEGQEEVIDNVKVQVIESPDSPSKKLVK